mmetsp:Transcript_12823/g.26523  ORF Transcript_12823/g.26523 Transcript_12823/m.26523 type:complete len:223 (-) Transcript_12823:1211-1879(-)
MIPTSFAEPPPLSITKSYNSYPASLSCPEYCSVDSRSWETRSEISLLVTSVKTTAVKSLSPSTSSTATTVPVSFVYLPSTTFTWAPTAMCFRTWIVKNSISPVPPMSIDPSSGLIFIVVSPMLITFPFNPIKSPSTISTLSPIIIPPFGDDGFSKPVLPWSSDNSSRSEEAIFDPSFSSLWSSFSFFFFRNCCSSSRFGGFSLVHGFTMDPTVTSFNMYPSL